MGEYFHLRESFLLLSDFEWLLIYSRFLKILWETSKFKNCDLQQREQGTSESTWAWGIMSYTDYANLTIFKSNQTSQRKI